jgi:hypothetical protein
MSIRRTVLALAASAAFLSPAQAEVFGYYTTYGALGNPSSAITASGNTAVALADLSAATLAGIDVLWILNAANGVPDAQVMNNVGAIANFVAAGGVLSFHDRNVNQGTSAGRYIPGASGVTFTANFFNNLDVQAINTVTNGPAGTLTNTSLDGGNFSSHGYASVATLPGGAVVVLSEGADATRAVDFYYEFGLGDVYYSSIPLDFYMTGGGNNPPGDTVRTVYAVNEATFQAQLRIGNEQRVPEPSTILLVALSGLMLLQARRATGSRR